MSRGALGKNNWALFLMLLAGIMLGGFIGNAAAGVSGLSWLNYGQSFGFASPIDLSSQEIEKPRAGENSCPRLFAYV